MDERLQQNQVERELGAIRDEVRSSAQALAAIGKNLLLALRQFDSTLNESNNRVLELNERASAGEQQLSDLKSAVQTIQMGLEQNYQVVAEFSALLERISRQVTNQADEFSDFRRDVQNILIQQGTNDSDTFGAVQASLAAVERRVDSLAEVLSLHTQEHADLSTFVQSLSVSIATLQATSEQTRQRADGLEKLRALEPNVTTLQTRLTYALRRPDLTQRGGRSREADEPKPVVNTDHIFSPQRPESLRGT